MSIKILMPALSPTMIEGALQKWLVKVGDKVKAGDILAEIETDKATMEIEAVDEGEITNILIKAGTESVAVNTPIAILNGSKDDIIDEKNNKEKKIDNSKKLNTSEFSKEKKIKTSKKYNFFYSKNNNEKHDEKIIASPLAKNIAKEKKIDLSNIKGSGPGGRIIKRDFEKIIETDLDLNILSKHTISEPSSMRKIIAQRTYETKKNIPHFYLTIESNVDKLLKLREHINKNQTDIKISINDILVKALALAQRNNPESNISWYNEKIIKYSSVDVSVAVALKEGLITPIVKNADFKGLLEISKEIKTLSNKAKEGKLTSEEYNGGTITISNLGMFGISEFSAIINPPQSMIIAIGSIKKSFKIVDEKVNTMSVLKSTLSVDHRAVDGATAAKFLKDFNDIIENPFNIWLQSEDMKII
tara:strand:- start:744 stop:1994 length:1251 start_codon:yes stop_codon:yes gene_type:complete